MVLFDGAIGGMGVHVDGACGRDGETARQQHLQQQYGSSSDGGCEEWTWWQRRQRDDIYSGGTSLDCDKTAAESRQDCDKTAAAVRQHQLRQKR